MFWPSLQVPQIAGERWVLLVAGLVIVGMFEGSFGHARNLKAEIAAPTEKLRLIGVGRPFGYHSIHTTDAGGKLQSVELKFRNEGDTTLTYQLVFAIVKANGEEVFRCNQFIASAAAAHSEPGYRLNVDPRPLGEGMKLEIEFECIFDNIPPVNERRIYKLCSYILGNRTWHCSVHDSRET